MRISTISHRIKIEKGRKDQEAHTVNISPQAFSRAYAMMKLGSRLETADEGATITEPSIRVPIRILEDLSKQYVASDARMASRPKHGFSWAYSPVSLALRSGMYHSTAMRMAWYISLESATVELNWS